MGIKKFGEETPENPGDNSAKKSVKKSLFDPFEPKQEQDRASKLGNKVFSDDETDFDMKDAADLMFQNLDEAMKASADLIMAYERVSIRPTEANVRAFRRLLESLDPTLAREALAITVATLAINMKQQRRRGI